MVVREANRIPELDGIRGAAILLVLLWHYLAAPLLLSSSPVLRHLGTVGTQLWSGVDLFFVLSGFLIGGILIDAKESPNYFRTFYVRRGFRILPIYIVVCSAFPLWRWFSLHFAHLDAEAMPWWVYATFTQNIWLRNHAWENVWFTHAWSLAVEEQFYLTLPALIWFAKRQHIWKIAVGGIAATLFFRSFAYLHYYPDWKAGAYTLLPCRADALMFGLLAATLVRNSFTREWMENNQTLLGILAAATGLPVALLSIKGWGMMSTAVSTLGYTLIAACYGCILLLAVLSDQGRVARVFRVRWLRWLGAIAYGLYLIHGHILLALFYLLRGRSLSIESWTDVAVIVLALCVALFAAWLSWTFFEAPLVRLGRHFSYKPAAVPELQPQMVASD